MACKLCFAEDEMAVDKRLGYPKAYAKLCRIRSLSHHPYTQGPPFAFLPYILQPQEALQAKDLNQMFPVIDPEAMPSVNPRGYVNLLWKQLDHLGNAGFDPALFRVDPYGNVLYLHADSASPLAWDIDHWFPCSRGGRTVPSNLRLLQWQVCKKKHNKLEFLVPWWDLQLGISVNQFLTVFASRSSDFRNRAFSFFFSDGGSEELNALQAVDSHRFPQHFKDMKRQVGLAPAAIVSSQRSSDSSVLKPVDLNRSLRINSPLVVARKFSKEEDDVHSLAIQTLGQEICKENSDPNKEAYGSNPYLTIALARDSLKLREETKKKQIEINHLDNELAALQQNNEAERLALQELETFLIKRKRRVEKCRRLAEAQSSYKALLEKMIRDALHQSVVYKEQLRLNQAATSALMARLEAQRANCDSSENELRRKFKQKDEIEKRIRPIWELRKRSRVDDTLFAEGCGETIKLLSTRGTRNPIKKELRIFLEEEQKASEAAALSIGEVGEVSEESATTGSTEKCEACSPLILNNDDSMQQEKLSSITNRKGNGSIPLKGKKSFLPSPMGGEEDSEYRITTNENLKQLATRGECSKTAELEKQNSSNQSAQEEGGEQRSLKYGDAKEKVLIDNKLDNIAMRESYKIIPDVPKLRNPIQNSHREDGEEYRNQIGKGNVEKWLQILLEDAQALDSPPPRKEDDSAGNGIGEALGKMDNKNRQKEIKFLSLEQLEENAGSDVRSNNHKIKDRNRSENISNQAVPLRGSDLVQRNKYTAGFDSINANNGATGNRKSFEVMESEEKIGFPKSESARAFRSLPSSPSMIMGMRRGIDHMGKKPKFIGNDDSGNDYSLSVSNSKFIRTCSKAIKKAINM